MRTHVSSSGVPLGGLGTGTVEIRRDGRFGDWQIFNNWGNWYSLPAVQMLTRAQPLFLDGAFLAVKAGSLTQKLQIRLLEKRSRLEMQGFGEIDYTGRFPMVDITYRGVTLPGLAVSLSAFSCFVPHNALLSSIPAVGLIVTFENESQETQTVSVVLSLEHPWGTSAESLREGDAPYLHLSDTAGDLCITSLDDKSTCFIPTDARTTCAYASQLLATLRSTEDLPSSQYQTHEAYGAVIAGATLEPGQRRSFKFSLTWFFPETAYEEYAGHIYENDFTSALDVARCFRQQFDQIHRQVRTWVETIYTGSLPEWFLHLVGNSLSLYAKNSLWSRNGRFGLFESFECPSVDNHHVRHPGAVALPQIYPELEAQILTRHAKERSPDGRLHEEFQPGGTRPSQRRNPYGRDFADIFSCFALMLCRYVHWTGDLDLLREIWPDVKAIMQYGSQRDDDHDGLPNRSAGNNTYDYPPWDCGDQMSYTAVLWLAALHAGNRLAGLVGDGDFAFWCDEICERGRCSHEEKLYNGTFYALGETNGRRIDACMVDALSGQWGALQSRSGYIVPREHLHSHIRSILSLNATDTQFGATNSLFADRRRDGSDAEGHDTRFAETIWPGATFAFAALVIAEGFVEEGMALIKRMYDNLMANAECSIWDMPDCIDPDTGLPHKWAFTHYLRCGSIWSALEAVTGFHYDGILKTILIAPPLMATHDNVPFVTPSAFGSFSYTDGTLSISVKDGRLDIGALEVTIHPERSWTPSIIYDGKAVASSMTRSDDRIRVVPGSSLTVPAGGSVSLT